MNTTNTTLPLNATNTTQPLVTNYTIDYNMVRIVDTIGKNILFRSSNPNNGTFMFDLLVSLMKQRTLEENYLWSDDCKIHLYSFLLNSSTVRDEHTPL